ncbi:MAG: ATP-dependent zinc metalloprotease FtsH [Planctomycetes bacterium]|nr:ATP-dependent zinc metalloprotease FtsH [Planctomycetota bacterium]
MESPSKERPTPPEKKPTQGASVLVWIVIALVGFFAFSFLFVRPGQEVELPYLELLRLIKQGNPELDTAAAPVEPAVPTGAPQADDTKKAADAEEATSTKSAADAKAADEDDAKSKETPTAVKAGASAPPPVKKPSRYIDIVTEEQPGRQRVVRFSDLAKIKVTPMEVTGTVTMEVVEGTGKAAAEPNVKFRTGRFGFENDNGALMQLLIEHGFRDVSAEGAPSKYSQWVPMLVVTAIMVTILMIAMRRLNGAGSPMSFGRSRGKMYAQEDIGVTFEDVAGIDEAVEELREVVEFLKSPEKFQRLGARIPKGVLLIGPPGTGKTLLAKAIAGEAGVPFFSLSGSDFVEMFVGVGAARVRDMFQQAEAKAPCIIFIDELDALGKTRGGNIVGGNDEREQTLNALLVEMDGFGSNSGVIVLAATNRPETLDPALMRPGRFDRQVVVDRPDVRGREKILNVHVHGVKLDETVDLKTVAKVTSGLAGADLANLVNESALLAARKGKSAVGMDDFNEGIDRVTAGMEKKHRVIQADEKQRMAYHEAGHALAAVSLPNTAPVHRVSIIPRGIGALASVMMRPEEDRYMTTHAELESYLQILLAGTITEEMIFNDVSTGAQNDLERASGIARAMVMDFGMSRLGRVTYRSSSRSPFLASSRDMGSDHTISEHTAREIDEEVKRIIAEATERTRHILTARKAALTAIAERVLEKEVIDGAELKQIVDAHSPGPWLVPGTDARRYSSTAPREIPPVARDLIEPPHPDERQA